MLSYVITGRMLLWRMSSAPNYQNRAVEHLHTELYNIDDYDVALFLKMLKSKFFLCVFVVINNIIKSLVYLKW